MRRSTTCLIIGHLEASIIRLHQSVVLDPNREPLALRSSMAPRLEPNFLPQLTREALRPLTTRIMLVHIFHSIRVDILLVGTKVV